MDCVSSNNSELHIKRIQQLRLMDDDFMSKCFEDNIECTEFVLRIILDQSDLMVRQIHTQHKIKNLQGRSVALDIYAVDSTGKQYNIEIQRTDRGAGAKRARYHSSIMDANSLLAGEDHNALKETYVIFITEHDVLKKGLPIYHIDRTIAETGEPFPDEAHIVYVNGSYVDESQLGLLMHDFSCTNPADMRYPLLAERARYFKEKDEGVKIMCKLLEDMCNEVAQETKKETAAITKKEMNKKFVRSLIEDDFSIPHIAKLVGITSEEVSALIDEIKSEK